MNHTIANVRRVPAAGVLFGGAISGDEEGGWTFRRRAVIDEGGGVCVRCGAAGADTATHGWGGWGGRHADDLVAAHTRCIVGLGPRTAYLSAA